MHWLTRGLLDLLFPPRCLTCGRFGPAALCTQCAGAMTPITPPFCDRCGLPFDPRARGGPLCATCRQAQRLPFALGRSAAAYDGPLRRAVHRLKYDGKRVLGRVLGEMLAAAMLDGSSDASLRDRQRSSEGARQDDTPSAPSSPWEGEEARPQAQAPRVIPWERLSLIVPVPLHPVRARERGFNQAELLVGPLAQRIEVPIAIHCVERVKLNPPQVAVPTALRRANVRGAFAVADRAAVAGRVVLIFDDVWTTGATLLECARVVRQAGAAEVYLLSLCRAVAP